MWVSARTLAMQRKRSPETLGNNKRHVTRRYDKSAFRCGCNGPCIPVESGTTLLRRLGREIKYCGTYNLQHWVLLFVRSLVGFRFIPDGAVESGCVSRPTCSRLRNRVQPITMRSLPMSHPYQKPYRQD